MNVRAVYGPRLSALVHVSRPTDWLASRRQHTTDDVVDGVLSFARGVESQNVALVVQSASPESSAAT